VLGIGVLTRCAITRATAQLGRLVSPQAHDGDVGVEEEVEIDVRNVERHLDAVVAMDPFDHATDVLAEH